MPEITIKHVVSCSSEDRNNPAENLLKTEGTHKWRTASPGEKSAIVVLQFEKSSQIQGVDIGNEGSAFVEILVGKATSTSDSDYQVLLVSSSFMSPADSRSGSNRNAVRMFGPDKLSKTVMADKWDRVKVVCTQPFSKSAAYGLSFIKFHSTPGSTSSTAKEGVKKLGAFTVRDEEDDDIKIGTLFASKGKKEETVTPPPSGAAAVRAASRLAEEARASTSAVSLPKEKSATRPTSKVKAEGAAKAAKDSPKKHAVSEDDTDTEEEAPPPRTPLKRQSSSLSSVASSRSGGATLPLKKTKTEPPKPSPAKAFSGLMEKVSFVLSGFQNPYRGQLRDKAMEMGATYKPDWGKGCTHLVCAFVNTPKYRQVQGKGRIVSNAWINDCYKQRKLLPWRKYRLGDADSPGDSSDEEEIIPNKRPSPKAKPPSTVTKDNNDKYAGDTDSADDTDEEIRRAQRKPSPVKKHTDPKSSSASPYKVKNVALDVFADSTDEDEAGTSNSKVVAMDTACHSKTVAMDTDDGADSGFVELPDFFAGKHFFLYGDFAGPEKRLLTRYIAAYDGVLEDYMNDRVKYVVTSSSWDDNFEEALSENPGLIFVKPQWIHSCHNKTKLLPYQPFIVVP